jgi:hypothetical protein
MIAGFILGSMILFSVFQYNAIPLQWKIATSTFILILPISFFMQAKMKENSLVTAHVTTIQNDFLKIYEKEGNKSIIQNFVDPQQNKPNLEKNTDFERIFRNISKLIHEGELSEYFSLVYEKILNDPRSTNEMRKNFLYLTFSKTLKEVIKEKLDSEGISFRYYLLPLTFFMIIYFFGMLMIVPLMNTIFTGNAITTYIPLFDEKKWSIPIIVIQWGFIGGVVYTSINLLYRFLRGDLSPSIYLYSSFRLIFATVSSVIVYFLYIITNSSQILDNLSPSILLICFAIGIAPIQFLIRTAQSIAIKIMKLKIKENTGNNDTLLVEGINFIISERLSEEGIDYIQQLAFCNPVELANKINYEDVVVNDWKDQALFHLFTGNIDITTYDITKTTKIKYMNELLIIKLGIRTYSGLKKIWVSLKNDSDKETFFRQLGLLTNTKDNLKGLIIIFDNISNSYIDNLQNNQTIKKTEFKIYSSPLT